MSDVEITRIPLSQVVDNEHNYQFHSESQIADLMESLDRFGQVEPAVVKWKGDGQFVLVAHEGVTEAARRLYKKDPLKYRSLNDYLVVIVPDHWTLEDVDGYMVASNALARLSSIDERKFVHLLTEQREAGYSLTSIGMNDVAFHELMKKANEHSLWEQAYIERHDDPPEKIDAPPDGKAQSPPTRERMTTEGVPQSQATSDSIRDEFSATTFRQLVLVMPQPEYDAMTTYFATLRAHMGLGSNADVVRYLMDFHLQHGPQIGG